MCVCVFVVDAIRKQMVNPWRECSDVLDAKSLGLGLHICHLVLQVLGSELHIESQDGSSEFSFTLTMPLEATSTAETTKVVRQTSYQRPDQERYRSHALAVCPLPRSIISCIALHCLAWLCFGVSCVHHPNK